MSRYQGRERGWEKATLPWPTSPQPGSSHKVIIPGLALPGQEGLREKDRHQVTRRQGEKGCVRGAL